ncbi:MAG: serine/threonine-protein kinase [Gemmataceae bacterium]
MAAEQTHPMTPPATGDSTNDPATRSSVPDALTTMAGGSGFDLLAELGRGGMGVVYRAVQRGLNRPAAVKLVLGGAKADPKQLIRFLAEAEAVAAVRHPHVVQVYEFGDRDGSPFLAMEYCPGGSLAGRLKVTGPLPPADAADLLAKVADGVAAAHAQGIVHRDLKPGNVLFDTAGEPKVADFGLAKRGTGADLTATDAILGTPAYMAPEQATGQTKFVGPGADVYSLGWSCSSAWPGGCRSTPRTRSG